MIVGTALMLRGPWMSCCRMTAPCLEDSSRQTVDTIPSVDVPAQSLVSTVQMTSVACPAPVGVNLMVWGFGPQSTSRTLPPLTSAGPKPRPS